METVEYDTDQILNNITADLHYVQCLHLYKLAELAKNYDYIVGNEILKAILFEINKREFEMRYRR